MRSPSSTCAPLMPQVSLGKQRSSRLFRFYLSSPPTPFLFARLSSPRRIEWPALPSSLPAARIRRRPNIKLLPFVCTDNRGEREREREEELDPRDYKILQSPDRDFYRRGGSFLFLRGGREEIPAEIDTQGKLNRPKGEGDTSDFETRTPSISPRPRENYS